MFRTAVLRSAAAATRAIRPAVQQSAPLARRSLVAPRSAFRTAAPKAISVRMYSSATGLNQQEVEGRIMALLQGFDKVNDPANIKPNAHFANDLGLDSLDTVEVVMAIEEEFSIEIPDKDADTIHSIDKAVEYIVSQPDAH
ncbi:Acyl carrier protein, mitochondrial [Colletotrichum tanaceti]|uniref:Acyl carrier protein n=1 Tax=Colletotrichum tanaceti TaxID=1306861 RepID=A0A4U6X5D4_9PEZI|nr:Acyl carrier protein, mitochondrial [Colletotrichum tanaceti]TKW50183.1 Acyl carrier protein, mitochondrial [Colletotrichum tanaceti]